jgi:uncharacterized protein (TIGR00369 family)
MSEVYRSRACFVCGTDNPGGMNLAPTRDGDKVIIIYTPRTEHLGFSKAVHGGIVASLLDEVVGVCCGQRSGGKCATVELSVRYLRPLLAGQTVRAEGWYVRKRGKFVFGKGQVLDERGKLLATARGASYPSILNKSHALWETTSDLRRPPDVVVGW